MKKILTYTEDELDQFSAIYNFLNEICLDIGDEYALTSEREKLIDEAINAVKKVQDMFNN